MKMDLRGSLVFGIFVFEFCWFAHCNLVFPVHHKFKGRENSLSAMKAHDVRRRGRYLSAVDLNLSGNGQLSETGLYYTKLGLGSPPKDYYVQVDTGSDILWVNCVDCMRCPRKSDLGIELTLYDPKGSKTSDLVSCAEDFCSDTHDGPIAGCKPDVACPYNATYADGSSSTGHFVKDYLTFNQVNGNFHSSPANSTVVFGCGAKQSEALGSTNETLDGILGFGPANSSVLSQLAASGKVKKIFSHCLDNIHGGGIFALGEVVEPKVNTTPLISGQAHYNVNLKDIEVDREVLQLPTDIFDSGNGRGTGIDSGTTLAYLPDTVYDQLISKVMAQQPGLKLHQVEDQLTCFQYTGNVDDGFPIVKFHFEESVSLTVYPHDYLSQFHDNEWCVGWQRSVALTKDGKLKDLTLLGDLVLSNRLVVYDLENMAIGWTEFDCSSSIKVKDETTGAVYGVGAHNISSVSTLLIGRILALFVLMMTMLDSIFY